MPSRSVLCLLLALVVLPPFAAQVSGTVVGSYTMFSRLERYHIELVQKDTAGQHRLSLRALRPHLSPAARRILLPAEGHAVGADQIDLVVDGLADLARLVCALTPGATSATARLTRDPFDSSRESAHEASVRCPASP
jgi:hypothetical protein